MALYRQPHSPYYWYDFTLDGKRYRGSTKQTGLTRARGVEADLILKLRSVGPDAYKPGKIPTLSDVLGRFMDFVSQASIEPATRRYYMYGCRLLQHTSLPAVPLNLITADLVEPALFGPESPSFSAHYRNQAVRTLKRLLSKAVDWKIISASPKLKLAKAFGRDVMIDAETELRLLYAASPNLKDILIIMMDTGARPSEVLSMRWENVFWSDRRIFIPRSKTEKGRRYVPMSARMMDSLLVRSAGTREGWVFPSDSKSGHIETIANSFRTARRRAGVDERIVPYSARHTFGTFAMKQTGNLPGVMSAMGHADVRSTLPYQHHGVDEIRDAIDARNDQARHIPRHTPARVN